MAKRMVLCLIGVVALMAPAGAQPSISADNNSVVNANSYLPDIARGSWFVIFGSRMGPAALAIASGAPFPPELSGTRVTFTPAAGGTAIDARLWYTSADQLAALLPSSAVAGDYDVRVVFNNQMSPPRRVRVVERNFGFATVEQNGSGPAQATNANLNNGASLVRFTTGSIGFNNLNWQYRPAYPGETLILWGTGLGPDTQSDVTGGTSGDQTAAGNIRVIVGDAEIVPAYAGRSSGSPGLDQINFTLPAGVTRGCTVSLQVRAGGRLSNFGSLAIANSGQAQCTHPVLTESQLRRLDQGGTLTAGGLGISKLRLKATLPGLGSLETMNEDTNGAFSRYSISQIADANFSIVQVGACMSFRRTGDIGAINAGTVSQTLNAGSQLTLNGPNVSNRALPNQQNRYAATLFSSGIGGGATGNPTVTQGAYTITGPGGPDIGPFTASVNFPGTFEWTNEASLPAVIPRNRNLALTWTGGGDGLVVALGFAGTQVSGQPVSGTYDVAGFVCTVQASAGTLTVPSSAMQRLPQVSGDVTAGVIGTLALYAIPDASRGQGTFTAPLTAGGTIDLGFFQYAAGTLKLVGYN
ncbi:MAG: hypothetical protein HYX27_08785 [Acidobacteria bacterium]|nr:hypothetical protein [Acidobacteriota bacterium]